LEEGVNLERRLKRAAAAALATVFLLVTAAPAQQKAAEMGEVLSCAGASINGAGLAGGGTIFDGDFVSTDANGEAVIKLLPEIQVLLNGNTSVVFSKVLDQVRLE
jgi:hypothetical protein